MSRLHCATPTSHTPSGIELFQHCPAPRVDHMHREQVENFLYSAAHPPFRYHRAQSEQRFEEVHVGVLIVLRPIKRGSPTRLPVPTQLAFDQVERSARDEHRLPIAGERDPVRASVKRKNLIVQCELRISGLPMPPDACVPARHRRPEIALHDPPAVFGHGTGPREPGCGCLRVNRNLTGDNAQTQVSGPVGMATVVHLLDEQQAQVGTFVGPERQHGARHPGDIGIDRGLCATQWCVLGQGGRQRGGHWCPPGPPSNLPWRRLNPAMRAATACATGAQSPSCDWRNTSTSGYQ